MGDDSIDMGDAHIDMGYLDTLAVIPPGDNDVGRTTLDVGAHVEMDSQS